MVLEFRDLSYAYGRNQVLQDVSFDARPGEVTCLLGASGSGKTTLLQLAAGLLAMQSGEIRLDGDVLANAATSPPPERRPVGLLFQEGALFPHMTVAANMAYGLKNPKEAGALVEGLLEQVGLPGFGKRYPHTLSGGQQQRVALARALAPNPRVLLMDEPFANIDSVRRQSLRETIAEAFAERDCIAILVTHDPTEAMLMASHVAMIDDGMLVQASSPAQMYDAPATIGVGHLIGGGAEVRGHIDNGIVRTAFGDWPVAVAASHPAPEGEVRVLIRPAPTALTLADDGLLAVARVQIQGREALMTLKAGNGDTLAVLQPRDGVVEVGSRVTLTPSAGALHLFDTDGRLIGV